jgi:hypothetical protein
MALVVPDASERTFLTRILTLENSKLKLYSNDYTATEATVIGAYVECAAGGYAQKTLTGTVTASTWTISSQAGVSTASYPEQEYVLTSALTAYGYYVTNNAENALLWAERFTGAPFAIPSGGGSIKVTLNITGE